MGYPVPPIAREADVFPLPWAAEIDAMTDAEAGSLMGNGMHAQVLFVVMCWLLACTERPS